jgi:hypothetical protein
MIEPGLAFVSTSKQKTLRTLVRVLLYGHVIHVPSCSLVLVSRHERIATVGDFYTEDAMQDLSVIDLVNHKQHMTTMGCMVDHIHLDNNTFSILFLKGAISDALSSRLFNSDCVHIYTNELI